MNIPEFTDDDAAGVLDLAKEIGDLLAGKPPWIQGAVISQVTARWVAGHFLGGPEFLETVMRTHMTMTRQALPVHVLELKQRLDG